MYSWHIKSMASANPPINQHIVCTHKKCSNIERTQIRNRFFWPANRTVRPPHRSPTMSHPMCNLHRNCTHSIRSVWLRVATSADCGCCVLAPNGARAWRGYRNERWRLHRRPLRPTPSEWEDYCGWNVVFRCEQTGIRTDMRSKRINWSWSELRRLFSVPCSLSASLSYLHAVQCHV